MPRTSSALRSPGCFALVLATLLGSAGADAQAQPPNAPPPAGAEPARQAPALPTIEVKDPMLAPVPPARHVLAGFREALAALAVRSSEIRIASGEVERSQGLARQALGRLLPTIGAEASLRQDLVSTAESVLPTTGEVVSTDRAPSTTGALRLSASQPLLAPRAWYALGTARRSVDVAKLSASDARRTVLASAANAIVAVVTAERVSEISRVGLRSALERLELTRRRTRLGTGTALDVVRAEQDATAARASLIAGDESLRQAREALGLALGSSEAHGVRPDISLDALADTLRRTCTVAAPDARADVLAARESVEVARRGITDARLGWAPSADLRTSLSYSAEVQDATKSYAWSIEGVLTIPIWDGGSRYGEIRSAKAGVVQQQARLEATQRAALVEAAQATRSVDVAQQTRAQSERTRDLARETARLTQIAFELGTATSFELVDAGRRQREAELDLALREFELVKAKLSALLATATCTY